MSVLEGPLVFVDIETTGMSFSRSRIIEVSALRVEDGEVVKRFNSLIDPGMDLPPFITDLTGISGSHLAGAPSFCDVSDELYRILDGAVFTAHNVRFDYGFLKHEFYKTGRKFNPRMLCTVKLSRALYPAARGHKLQDLIDRCELEVKDRHRAYDDAEALLQFIQHVRQVFPAPAIEAAISQQLKSPSLPKGLDPKTVRALPQGPGVYIFQDDRSRPLYVGKSVNIKKRVMSHFAADHEFEGEFKISQHVVSIKTIVTGGELEALLLESKLIKDLQPLYNRQLRRRQKLTLARKKYDGNGYITVNVEDVPEINPASVGDILGVFATKGKARQFISQTAKDFRLCPKMMGLENSRGSCFAYQLKRCEGACLGAEPADAYNQRLLTAFGGRHLQKWPYKSPVIIEERTDSDSVNSIIVDQWCVIASISQRPECDPVIKPQSKMFDLDTYKILRSFMNSKLHRLSVRPVSMEWVQSMTANSVV